MTCKIKTILCKRCEKPKFVSVFKHNTRFQGKRGIRTKYPNICDDCLTNKERKEVAERVKKAFKKGAVGELGHRRQAPNVAGSNPVCPRKKYDKALEIKGTREVHVKGKS